MSFHQWDRDIAPVLRVIAELSKQCATRATSICSAVQSLPARPQFVTKAEVELEAAIRETARSLQMLRAAQKAYRKTAVMTEVSDEA